MNNPLRKYITLLVAITFSWLFVASLINFHRAHLFGHTNALLYTASLKTKTDKEKSLQWQAKPGAGDSFHHDAPAGQAEGNTGFARLPVSAALQELFLIRSSHDVLHRVQSLRAPPLA